MKKTYNFSYQVECSIDLVPYSSRSIALFGDTRPIKDKLKEVGGRYNPNLTYEGVRQAGWVFPAKRIEETEKILEVTNN